MRVDIRGQPAVCALVGGMADPPKQIRGSGSRGDLQCCSSGRETPRRVVQPPWPGRVEYK